MKVFISWSGQKSMKIAQAVDDWLNCSLQAVDTWISTNDIDRGSLWFTEINNHLKDTSIGILCLTRENVLSPWILFEAGALSKGLDSNRICTLLIDLEPTDIKDPLAQFNHSRLNKSDFEKLFRTINSKLEINQLKENIIKQVFEIYWPKLNAEIQSILAQEPEPVEEIREETDMLKELLSLTRNLDKRLRQLEVDDKNYYNKSSRKNIDLSKLSFLENPKIEDKTLIAIDMRIRELRDNGVSLNQIPIIINEEFQVNSNIINNRFIDIINKG